MQKIKKKIIPHPYQHAAICAAVEAIREDKNVVPLIKIEGGGGKGYVNAAIAYNVAQSKKRCLCLVDSKELVEQNEEKFIQFLYQRQHVSSGVYCAGLNNRKESGQQVILASIQSYKGHAYDSGVFDYVVIDEAHMISSKEGSMYQKVFAAERAKNPKVRFIIMTASPYRIDCGMLEDLEMPSPLYIRTVFETNFLEMVKDGFLTPAISTRRPKSEADMSHVHKRLGEYIQSEAEEAFMAVLPAQIATILEYVSSHKKAIIFAQSVTHAEAIKTALDIAFEATGYDQKYLTSKGSHATRFCGVIHGGIDRDAEIKDFKEGKLKILVNVMIAVKGFDVNDIDLVVLMFSTLSIAKYIQTVCRGSRTAEGKLFFTVLDFGGNIKKHGSIDEATQSKPGEGVAPTKECPECDMIVHLNVTECPGHHLNGEKCDYIWQKPERSVGKNLTSEAADGGITSEEPSKTYFDDITFEASITKKTDPCVIVSFWAGGQRPEHRMWLNLWNAHKFVAAKEWAKINAFSAGKGAAIKEQAIKVEDKAGFVADFMNSAYSGGLIPHIDFILTLPQKNNPKYNEVVSWGTDDVEEQQGGKQTMTDKCKCGKGYASDYDGVCRFCREKLFRRAEAKRVNVRHRGDGMSIDQMRVLKGEVQRNDVYI